MKPIKLALIFLLLTFDIKPLYSQIVSKPVYVIVHGTWAGGWAFKKVDSLLTTMGNIVYRPTLTGQGERVHLASRKIGLNTHINDVVNMILYEKLQDVILIGHSYGGMVITGVADSIPSKISKMIYIDAVVPENNENMVYIIENVLSEKIKLKQKNGYIIPTWVPENKLPPKDVPQSMKTYTDRIKLKNTDRLNIKTTYILTVGEGLDPRKDLLDPMASRAINKKWSVLQLEADHNPQWSRAKELAIMLHDIGNQ